MKRALSVVCGVVLLALWIAGARGAGSVSTTRSSWGSINRDTITYSITSNKYVSGSIKDINGEILRVVVSAQSKATSNPTITLTDGDSIDLFRGKFTTVSNTAAEITATNSSIYLPCAVASETLTLAVTNSNISNAVATNGTIKIWWR